MIAKVEIKNNKVKLGFVIFYNYICKRESSNLFLNYILMKKHILGLYLVVLALYFFPNTLNAQEDSNVGFSIAESFTFGFKIGPNSSNLNTDWNEYTAHRLGISTGLNVEYAVLSDLLIVSVEGIYHTKGSRKNALQYVLSYNSPLQDGDITKSNLRLQTIEIPLLIHFQLSNSVKNRFYIGGSTDFILKANSIIEENHYVASELMGSDITKSNITERFKNNDYGMIVGTSINFDLSPLTILIDLRYRSGLSNLNNVSGFTPFNSNTVSLMLGVGF